MLLAYLPFIVFNKHNSNKMLKAYKQLKYFINYKIFKIHLSKQSEGVCLIHM